MTLSLVLVLLSLIITKFTLLLRRIILLNVCVSSTSIFKLQIKAEDIVQAVPEADGLTVDQLSRDNIIYGEEVPQEVKLRSASITR